MPQKARMEKTRMDPGSSSYLNSARRGDYTTVIRLSSGVLRPRDDDPESA